MTRFSPPLQTLRRGLPAALLALTAACAATPGAPPAAPAVDTAAAAPETGPAVAVPETPETAPAAVEAAAIVTDAEAQAALIQSRREAENAAIVTAFYELIFVQHRVAEAFDLYGGEGYIQHSPGSPDGRAAVEAALTPYFEANPQARSEIKRVVAQGDLVVLHVHAKSDPIDRGRAVVEIFRVEDGRIVEHWDVIQPIPASAANENSMF
jgi:predicted SnoaL-like aldol condensation-catalyzing enzyme